MINLFADYSATTPTDAGYFLKKKLYQKYSKQKEIRILNKNIQNLEEQLGYKKELNSNLNHSLVKISNHFDASNQKLQQQLKDNQKSLLNFEQSLITIQRNMSTLDSSHKKYNMLIGAMLLIIVLLSGVIIKINL
ncbi:hypothetical protein [uncultured Acinetobacter sp.]|uniref:hypothetical protein n=1 Tax=uncultured Acinetobacter sp. TaxID=165433 RepID=UPI00261A8337|nr:hypothetical protein [uncultured Acinetobacter sp.]